MSDDTVIPLPAAHPIVEVDLTQGAEWLLLLREDSRMRLAYHGALGLWSELLGVESDAAAIAYAEQLHAARPARTLAAVPPF